MADCLQSKPVVGASQDLRKSTYHPGERAALRHVVGAVVEVLAATADKNGIVDRAHARFLRACGKLAVAKGAANVSASTSTAVSDDMQTKPARAGVLPHLDAPLQAALLAFREHEGQQRRCTWTFTQDVLLLHQ